MGGEVGVAVRNQSARESVPWVKVLVIQLRNLGACDRFLAREENGGPGAPVVDDSQYAVVASAFRKSHDQVHGYLGERGVIIRYRDFVQGGLRPVRKVFVLLADCAPLDILFDPGVSSRPAETVEDFPGGLVSAWVGR